MTVSNRSAGAFVTLSVKTLAFGPVALADRFERSDGGDHSHARAFLGVARDLSEPVSSTSRKASAKFGKLGASNPVDSSEFVDGARPLYRPCRSATDRKR
jgi:hypothetical protein